MPRSFLAPRAFNLEPSRLLPSWEFAMRFLSKRKVSEKIGLSRTEIDRKEAAGKFPTRVQVGFRVFWVESEVDGWMEALIAKRNLRWTPIARQPEPSAKV